MPRSNKWVAFVTKLNQQTQEGRVEWESVGTPPDLLSSDFQQYGPVYTAELDNATVRIYRERIRRLTDMEEEYWEDSVVLELKAYNRGDFVRLPYARGLEDLYESVVYKTGRVDEFVEKFLREK